MLHGFLLSCVGPVILVLSTGGHFGTGLDSAELGDGPVEHADLIEEVDDVDGDPLVSVFARRQHYCILQIPTPQSRRRVFE